MSSTAIIIPARLDSVRLPGKLLLKWKNKEILRHVFETASVLSSRNVEVWVATDNQSIKESVESWGGNVFMSSGKMRNGTERIQDFAQKNPHDFYINVQGDDPTIPIAVLEATLQSIKEREFAVVTPHYRINSIETLVDPNKVKLVKNHSDKVLYFSRSAIPHYFMGNSAPQQGSLDSEDHCGHIGVYGYTQEALHRYVSFSETRLERSEKLEQLRFLENSIDIGTFEVDFTPNSIDCIEDLENLENLERS
jgi:3-deoxy-manno-octulosonate cytidylyltransferase (CMP-KDO synthetase)